MARDEQALREYAERVASILIGAGFPRMPARVLMMLMIAESNGLTASELAEQLGASPAAVSGAVRYLQSIVMMRRVAQPGSRRDVYELPDDAWYTASLHTNPMYDQVLSLGTTGIAAAGGEDDPAYHRIDEMNSFFGFIKGRLPDLLVEWKAQQAGHQQQAEQTEQAEQSQRAE